MFYREPHHQDFTCLDNGFLRDKTLSLKARGLLATILSFPNDRHFCVEGLVSILPDGKTSVENALRELEEAGHIERKDQRRDAFGRLGYNVWDIYERVDTQRFRSTRPPVDRKPKRRRKKDRVGTDDGFSADGVQAESSTDNANTEDEVLPM